MSIQVFSITLFFHERLLHLTWRYIFQCTMWSLSIVEFNIRSDTSLELRFRFIILSVKILLFQCCKKRFRYGIVMRSPRIGKGLLHGTFMK